MRTTPDASKVVDKGPLVLGPVFNIPSEYISGFTMGGRVPVTILFIDEVQGGQLTWSRQQYDTVSQAARHSITRRVPGRYSSDVHLTRLLRKHPIRGQKVLIIGSQVPFYEAFARHFGGLVTTVEYRPIVHDIEGIETFTVDELSRLGLQFDCGISISSIEHSGLGRYGDAIDPDGDLKAMRMYAAHIKKGGHLFLQVPIGRDCVAWNAHRIYGEMRLPLLLQGWQVIDTKGFKQAVLSCGRYGDYQEPVFLLRNA